jgi:hypothetical protein
MLFIEGTHHTYVVYGMAYHTYVIYEGTHQAYLFYPMNPSNLFLTLWIHLTYSVYNMDPSNLCCLRNGTIKLMLFTEGTTT